MKVECFLYIICLIILNNIQYDRLGKVDFVELKARAKINLSLDVTGKRQDGYHEVEMIMQTVELHDTVCLEISGSGITIESKCPWIPEGEGNIAYKAAELFRNKYGVNDGVRITIIKRIPVAAGLAGGSSDAAAVLKGMNRLFSKGIGESELLESGKLIGADVPYCIKGGTALACGIGEILTELKPLPKTFIVIVKPDISISTAWVYKNLNLSGIEERPDTKMLLQAVGNGNTKKLAANMRNVLESVSAEKYGVIKDIKRKLREYGALGSMMSGSGPSVFGIFTDGHTAQSAYKRLKSRKWNCFLTETVNPD